MGFFIRKSFGGKHLKFNLSKSGIGTSFGIKGLRFGVDSKGRSYLSGGKGMFRYREYIDKDGNKQIEEIKPSIGARIFGIILALLIWWIPIAMFCSVIKLPPEDWKYIYWGANIYFLPLYFNILVDKKNTIKTILLNLFLGWTGIVWLGLIIYSIIWKIKEKKKENNA